MKKYILLLLLVSTLSFNLKSDKNDIIGKWSGKDKNQIGSIIFDSEGYVTIELGGEIIGGEKFKMGDKLAKMTYIYYDNKNPVEINLIMSELDGKHIRTIYLFAEFKNKNTIKVAFLRNKNDTREFNDDNSIILNRQK